MPFSYAVVDGVRAADVQADLSYNATGQGIETTRRGVGQYEVTFKGLGEAGTGGGHVQVTGYNHRRYCKVENWSSSGADFVANVDCYNSSGEFRDSSFSMGVIHPNSISASASITVNEAGLRYAWAGNSSAASYTANALYAANGLDTVGVERTSVGTYRVTFENHDASNSSGGHVQVSAYGNNANKCAVVSWTNSEDFVATVGCTNPSGNRADTQFAISVIPPIHASSAGFAWTNNPTGINYNPDPFYSHNPGGGQVIANNVETGRYAITFKGLNVSGDYGGHVQATAYGDAANYCTVRSIGAAVGNDLTANIECYDSNQQLVNTRFTILALPEPEGDRFEPNDTLATATAIGSIDQTIADLSILQCGGENDICSVPDYYKWTANRDADLNVGILFKHATGDLDLELLNASGVVVASSESRSDNESLTWTVRNGEDYFVRVTGFVGATNDYDLTIGTTEVVGNNIFDIRFTPDSPADLTVSQDVTVSFRYTTSETDGVRLFARPLTDGATTLNGRYSASPLYTEQSGATDTLFTIWRVGGHVEEVSFEMWNHDASELLVEVIVGVDYDFSASAGTDFFNIRIDPSSPAILDNGDPVEFSYEYATDLLDDVSIEVAPLTEGNPASVSVFNVADGANGNGFFTADSGEVDVDGLALRMWNRDRTRLIHEEIVPTSIRFSSLSRVLGDFTFDGVLGHDDIDALCSATRSPQPPPEADLDRSGTVDGGDLKYLVEELMQSTFGDANLDRVFDSSDLVNLFAAAEYEDGDASNSSWATGDFNCDLEFDSGDLVAAFSGARYELVEKSALVSLRPHFFMPPHTEGDRDFFSTPDFGLDAQVAFSGDRREIRTRVRMDAREVNDGDTRANGWSEWETAYVAPEGREIVSISSPAGEVVGNHGAEYNGRAVSFAGHAPKIIEVDSNLVNYYEVVADTDGDDAGVKTGVRVHFEAIAVELSDPTSTASLCTVSLADMEWEPPLVRGDNDFFGSEPKANAYVQVQLNDGDVEGRMYVHYQEWDRETNLPRADHTTFDGWSPWQTLYSGQAVGFYSDQQSHGFFFPPSDDPDIGVARSSGPFDNLVSEYIWTPDADGPDSALVEVKFQDVVIQQATCDEGRSVPLRSHYFRPEHIAGDRDFFGNGPEVEVISELRINPDDPTRLESRVLMSALETEGNDPTHAFGQSGWETAYVAPAGQEIIRIDSPQQSVMPRFVDTDHAADLINSSGVDLVRQYEIVGDTDGNDAGVSTAVRVHFHPAEIHLGPASSLMGRTLRVTPHTLVFDAPVVRGDPRVGDNERLISSYVETRIHDGEMQARVYLNIQEWADGAPAHDFTTFDGWSGWRTVSTGDVPLGSRIKRILGTADALSSYGPSRSDAVALAGNSLVTDSLVYFEGNFPTIEVRFHEVLVELEDGGG